MNGIEYPVDMEGIATFEKQNAAAVNVFEVKPFRKFECIRVSGKEVDQEHVINVLLIWEGEKSHFVYIHNLCALLGKQISKRTNKAFYCFHCLRNCKSKDVLDRHRAKCSKNTSTKEILPKKGDEEERDKLFFKNEEYCVERPFLICADFETWNDHSSETTARNGNVSSTHVKCAQVFSYNYTAMQEFFKLDFTLVVHSRHGI